MFSKYSALRDYFQIVYTAFESSTRDFLASDDFLGSAERFLEHIKMKYQSLCI